MKRKQGAKFFELADKVIREIKFIREWYEAHATDHDRINTRLDTIEQHVGIPTVA